MEPTKRLLNLVSLLSLLAESLAARGVLLAELVDAAAGVHNLLLAGIEGMAVRAHFDLQVMTQCRARDKYVATAASHIDVFVIGMNAGFHDCLGLTPASRKMGRAV